MKSATSRIWQLLVAVLFPLWTGALHAEGHVPLVDVRNSPHAAVQGVGIDEVHWTDGFWACRVQTCRDRSIPSMWDLMESGRYKPFLAHFRIAAGQEPGEYHGAKWNDGDFYKWIEAATAALAASPDDELSQHLATAVETIAAAQRADGYLHTPVLIAQRNGEALAKPFGDRFAFEMYNMGHLITTACLHYRITDSGDLLTVAERAAGFLEEAFKKPTPQLARHAVCPSHYMGLVELYRTTGDRRYMDLAQKLFNMRRMIVDGGDDNQDRIPFTEQRQSVGHAVRANYLYAGAADLYLETGDPALWKTLDAVWHDVVEKKLYITAGCGALYDGASPDGSPEQEQITRVHQAYGRNYQLPNVTAHNETCANVGLVLWNWRMFLATGEARFVDLMETALYNSVLSGVSLDGSEYFYVNPLRNVDPLPTELRYPRTRQKFFTSFCCPPNVVRTIAEVGGYAYSKHNDSLWINLYGGSELNTTLNGQPISIVQSTDYPWSGDVSITVEEWGGGDFELKLRIPAWAESASLRVNGQPVNVPTKPGTYAVIRRVWKAGDRVQLELPMPVELMESHPLVEETTGQVAVRRGPVVYCLESADLPSGVKIADVALRSDADFKPRYDPNLLGGLAVIETQATIRRTGDWNGQLYRPLQTGDLESVDINLIPYFAWANRGPGEMSVWMPVVR
jgi:uncharacterized protein